MTINKLPNQDDVLYNSGVRGIEATPLYNSPRHFRDRATGSADIRYTHYGARVSGSATAGDVAKLDGLHNPTVTSYSEVHTVISYWTTGDAPPYTDDVELGVMDNGINADAGAYLDFTTGEYHAGATTAAATLPSNFDAALLRIEQDLANGETRFYQRGKVNEDVTVADVSSGQYVILQYNSNGAGSNTFGVPYYRQVFVV